MSAPSLKALQDFEHAGLCRRDGAPATQRPTFMIATGLECSYPTVEGGKRRDELNSTGHYQHWREDFDLCKELGARYVRYGLPYYKMNLGPGKYSWDFADEVLPAMWDKGLIPLHGMFAGRSPIPTKATRQASFGHLAATSGPGFRGR